MNLRSRDVGSPITAALHRLPKVSFSEDLDFFLSAKLGPFFYHHLSRHLPSELFDNLLCFLFSSDLDSKTERLESDSGNFFFSNKEKDAFLEIIKKNYPQALESTLAEADLIVDHVFDLLGSGPVNLGSPIDWHRDFKSASIWEEQFYKDISRIRLDDNSDIKVPWELSRFHHLGTLGRAYWISGREQYAKEFVDQTLDWLRCNPPRIGVNWCSSMEVAIRLANWISAYFFFKDSPSFSKEVKKIFFKNLLIHQIFIYHNLEFGYRLRQNGKTEQINGNHYAANLMGLILPTIVFPALSSKRFRRRVLHWLYREILSQVNRDGVHYELSSSYHRLVAEIFLSIAILMLRNSTPLPALLMDTIQRMLEFVMAYIRPDGLAPQVRDADDGRLFSFTDNPVNAHQYLLNIGAVLCNRADFKGAAPSFSQEALWWVGPDGFDKFHKMPNGTFKQGSRAFPDSGFYFMQKNGDYLMALCSGVGMAGYGAHGHNDALSFELFTQGKSVLIDPGTYVYSADPAMRNLFKSTAYHNTVRIDAEEINSFDQNRLFSLPEQAHPKVDKWVSRENRDVLVARHSGYQKLPGQVIHRRVILYNKRKRYWKITDHLMGRGSHNVEIFFHFGLDLIPNKDVQENSIILRDRNGFCFALIMKRPSGWNIKFTRGWVSPSYGIKKVTWIACCSKLAEIPLKATFILKSVS